MRSSHRDDEPIPEESFRSLRSIASSCSGRRSRTSYIPRGMSKASKRTSENRKTSVQDSLLRFLEPTDETTMGELREDLIWRARSSLHTRVSGIERKQGGESQRPRPKHAGIRSTTVGTKRKGRKSDSTSSSSSHRLLSNSRSNSRSPKSSHKSKNSPRAPSPTSLPTKKKRTRRGSKRADRKTGHGHHTSNAASRARTEKRVRKARQQLDQSLHMTPQDKAKQETLSQKPHQPDQQDETVTTEQLLSRVTPGRESIDVAQENDLMQASEMKQKDTPATLHSMSLDQEPALATTSNDDPTPSPLNSPTQPITQPLRTLVITHEVPFPLASENQPVSQANAQSPSAEKKIPKEASTTAEVGKSARTETQLEGCGRTDTEHTTTTVQSNPPSTSQPHLAVPHVAPGLRPKTDLLVFLKHLALMNDFKSLTDTNHSTITESSHSLSTAPPSTSRKRTPFQHLFQLKCAISSILDASPEEAKRKQATLIQRYELDPKDMSFVMEHVELCLQDGTDIRWDLIRTMFFPLDESLDGHTNSTSAYSAGYQSMPAGMDLAVPTCTSMNWNSVGDLSAYWNSTVSPSDYQDSESRVLLLEEYQEVFLDLYESSEASMEDLTTEECQVRREILVQLLQATSESEAHLTSLSLEDVSEIVQHVRISNQTDTEVEWDMIRDIVFPLGRGDEQLQMSSSLPPTNQCTSFNLNQSMPNLQIHQDSFMLSQPSQSWEMMSDFDVQDQKEGSFGSPFNLSETELGVVLNHINLCNDKQDPIRWDLIGEILFPGDPMRQAMLCNGIMEDVPISDPITGTTTASKQRQLAILKLSAHSWEELTILSDDNSERSFDVEELMDP